MPPGQAQLVTKSLLQAALLVAGLILLFAMFVQVSRKASDPGVRLLGKVAVGFMLFMVGGVIFAFLAGLAIMIIDPNWNHTAGR